MIQAAFDLLLHKFLGLEGQLAKSCLDSKHATGRLGRNGWMDGWMDEEGWKAQDKTELLTNTLETYVKEVGLSAAFDLLLYKYRDLKDSLIKVIRGKSWLDKKSMHDKGTNGWMQHGWMDGWMV